MTTAYPAALDAYGDPAGNVTQGSTTPTHSAHHKNHNDAVEAIEAKLGIGSSTAAANTVLTGTGAGQTAFGQVQTAMLAPAAVSQGAGAVATASQTTNSGAPVLIIGSQVTLTIVGTGTVLITATGSVRHSAAGATVVIYAYVDTANQGQYTNITQPVANGNVPFSLALAVAVSAGSHTFSLYWATSGADATLHAATISVVELKK